MQRQSLKERVGTDTIDGFIEKALEDIREQIGDKKALCALSGGVDSAVSATLVYKAIGENLTCMFVDHNFMRKGEPEMIEEVFGKEFGMKLISVDAKSRFMKKVEGISDPEKKRKAIGEEFIRVFEDESKKIGDFQYLVQGTIYPDILESKSEKGTIKSHHNVGGLPEDMEFELTEPVKYLYKDEVREVGLKLGLPEEQVYRQPFPGPGLAVRVVGEITQERLETVRESDAILREEIKKAGLHKEIWQYFTVNPGCRSVGIKDGKRTYENAIVIRAILSEDATKAEVAQIPYDLLNKIALRIVDQVENVNRVIYDITPKPPATIEWE